LKTPIAPLSILLLTLFTFMPRGAHAAGFGNATAGDMVLAPVVVTAEKRAEEAQKVPASVTVFGRSEIEDKNITNAADLAEEAPNLEFHDFGSRRHGLLFLRGIKSLPGGQAGTGFTVDGVTYDKAYMFGFPLFDVDRIEVLRGAQGTLYGRNTTGGVINVHTAQPEDEFSSTVGTTVGSYGSLELRANASGPLVEDRLWLGVYGLAHQEDGFMENDVAADGEEGRHQDGKAARINVRCLATEDLEMTLSLDAQHHDDGAYTSRRTERNSYVLSGVYDVDDEYHYSHDFEGSQEVDFWGASLNTQWRTSLGTLHSISGYRNYDSDEWIDADFAPLDYMRKNYRQQDEDLSQEFRLTSPEDDGPLKWLVGAYAYHLDDEANVSNHFGSDAGTASGMEVRFDTTRKNSGGALFGEGTYTLFPRLDLTLGLRAEYEHAEGESTRTNISAAGVSSVPAAFDREDDFTALLPKASLAAHLTDDVMAYATVARAHKSGGFNDASAPSGEESYGEEDSWLYELGVKSYALDRRLMVNAAAFYTVIDNEQLPLYQASVKQGYLANAGKSHRTGVELESQFKLTEAWTLSGSGSWIDARFDEYEDASLGLDYAGERVFCVPEYSYQLALDYRDRIAPDWVLFGRAELSGVGSQYFDNANTVRQGAYELVNLRLGFQWNALECSLWVKNLLNRQYVAFENTEAGIAEDGKPRTVGLSVNYTF